MELTLKFDMRDDDDAIVNAFMLPARRPRWRAMLAGPARRRRQMLDHLNHCADLDERYAHVLSPDEIPGLVLRHRGAPATCYVLSDDATIDGTTLPVADALDAVAAGGWGAIPSCIPGRLAMYLDEQGTRRQILLERPPGQPARQR